MAVSKDYVDGFVDTFLPDDQGARLGGWAVIENKKPADRLLAFVGGRLVAQGTPLLDRPDIASDLGETARKSGFTLRAGVTGAKEDDFRVFAVYWRTTLRSSPTTRADPCHEP